MVGSSYANQIRLYKIGLLESYYKPPVKRSNEMIVNAKLGLMSANRYGPTYVAP